MPEETHPKHGNHAPSNPPTSSDGAAHRVPRSRRRRWLAVGALTLAVVTGAGGVATADAGVPFKGMHKVISPTRTTRTASPHGALTISHTRCRFWHWCRPAPVQAPDPTPTSPEATPTDAVPETTPPAPDAEDPAPTTAPPDPSPSAPDPEPAPTEPTPTNTPAPTPQAGDALAQQILDQLNEARESAGVAPLTTSSGLVASAEKHTKLMADGCGLSHECSGEASLGDRISAEGVNWSSVGENIGYGGPVARTDEAIVGMCKEVTEMMLAETPPNDGHRRNILNSGFRHVGIYIFQDDEGTVWMTQDFSS